MLVLEFRGKKSSIFIFCLCTFASTCRWLDTIEKVVLLRKATNYLQFFPHFIKNEGKIEDNKASLKRSSDQAEGCSTKKLYKEDRHMFK